MFLLQDPFQSLFYCVPTTPSLIPRDADPRHSHDAFVLSNHPCLRFVSFIPHVELRLEKPWPLKASCIITTLGYAHLGDCPEMLSSLDSVFWTMAALQEARDTRCYQMLTPDPCREKTWTLLFSNPKIIIGQTEIIYSLSQRGNNFSLY